MDAEQLIISFYKWLIPVCITGGAVRAIYCFIQLTYNEEEKAMYTRRCKNTVKFTIIASLVEVIKLLVESYFGG